MTNKAIINLKPAITRLLLLALFAVGAMGAAFMLAPDVLAQDPIGQAQQGIEASGGGGPSLEDVIATVTNILLFIVGAAAVIMLIVGAIRYVTSAGDASQASAAKNTILYSLAGLVIALAAYGIVNFVLDQF